MGYRKISRCDAKDMAKAAGLTRKQIWRCDFRQGMAEDAVMLIIALSMKAAKKGRSAV